MTFNIQYSFRIYLHQLRAVYSVGLFSVGWVQDLSGPEKQLLKTWTFSDESLSANLLRLSRALIPLLANPLIYCRVRLPSASLSLFLDTAGWFRGRTIAVAHQSNCQTVEPLQNQNTASSTVLTKQPQCTTMISNQYNLLTSWLQGQSQDVSGHF